MENNNKKILQDFTILPVFYEAVSELEKGKQGEVYLAIVKYGITGEETDLKDAEQRAVFKAAKPYIDEQRKNL